jgi:broad specificity polyphosphatase/5'/3'-nucleotidase SurE
MKMAWREPLFLTNDDGIDSGGIGHLIRVLHARGHPLAVLAPKHEQSASGMKLTLKQRLGFAERDDLIESLGLDPDGPPIRLFSLDGTPCDCVIVAIDGGFDTWAPEIQPLLCVSGINRGPNVSVDITHSGTIAAAREAALYGMPGIAVSLGTYSHEEYEVGMEAVLELIDRALALLDATPPNLHRPEGSRIHPWADTGLADEERLRLAFRHGDLFLNVNTPSEWSGGVETVGLGARWYHGATDRSDTSALGIGFEVGASSIEDEPIPDTDCFALMKGNVAISPLATWPQTHPLSMPDALLTVALEADADGYPNWLNQS